MTPTTQSVVVPVEPTDEMLAAWLKSAWPSHPPVAPLSQIGLSLARSYRAMLAAAPAPSSLAGGDDDFAHDLARTLDRYGLKDAGWSDADIADALEMVGEPSGVSQATVKAIMPMIEARLAALSPEVPAREVPDDVRRLVIAARNVAFDDPTQAELRALDIASEAFASRIPWDDEPDAITSRHEVPTEEAGEDDGLIDYLENQRGECVTDEG